jgi:hypothetical protein
VKKKISVIVLAAMLAFAPQAVAQEQQDDCGWYWWTKFNPSGGWEYWCWSDEWGWWYAESEDGKSKSISPKSNGPVSFFST